MKTAMQQPQNRKGLTGAALSGFQPESMAPVGKALRKQALLQKLAAFFTFCIIALFLLQLVLLTSSDEVIAAAPAAFESWAKTARIGGAATWVGMEPQEIDQILSELEAQNVTVIEADSDLSNYLTDAEFEQELALMSTFAAEAHNRGLKVVWYYSSLEVLTPNGKNLPHTMYKDHPDWVQVGLGGIPNVFYGGGGQVFWVEKDMESAWMSPSSPYRDYFFERVQRIVETGVDGLWVDVPIYADFGPTLWSDLNPYAVTKFKNDTGLDAPTAADWDNPVWRRWIAWRHEEIALFLRDTASAAQSINPDFPIIAETLPTDYNGATVYGLDAGYVKNIEGVAHVWEVDVLSNNSGLRRAREDDWISFISAFKYAKAASGNKPSWVFTYGKQADDAELVMAEALMAGNNPYELKVPEMTTTVGPAYRTRMFGWTKENSAYLFERESAAKVAVLYSSASRDFVDRFEGLGMFVTTQSSDPLWWAEDAIDSAYQRQYLAEFRGMVKLLIHEHIPFNIIVNPDLAELASYRTVILPDVEAMSDAEAAMLGNYVSSGGNLIVTGPNPSGLDQYGGARTNYALSALLGFTMGDPLPGQVQRSHGAGNVHFYSALLGKGYFVNTDPAAHDQLLNSIQQTSTNPLSTNADRRVHIELSQAPGQDMVLQFANFIGLTGSFSVVPTSFSVTLGVPAGKQVASVSLTSPDLPTPTLNPIAYSEVDQAVTFDVTLDEYAMVVVALEDHTGGENTPPVADNQSVETVEDTGVTLTLTGSDGDGDQILFSVLTLPAHGSLSGSAPNLTYTPNPGFTGSDSFDFVVNDGALDSPPATVTITVTDAGGGGGTISNFAAGLTIDGDLSDWATLVSFGPDPADVTGASNLLDWREGWIAHDSDNFYLALRNNADFLLSWACNLYLDTDSDGATGFHGGAAFPLGAEYLVQGGYLFQYAGDGTIWSWTHVATLSQAINGPDAEFAFPRAAIGSPLGMRLFFYGDNTAYPGGSALDLYPDQALDPAGEQRFFEYTTNPRGANQAPLAHAQWLTITAAEALSLRLTASDPDGDPLSYSIVSAPQNGSLSGTAPDLTYTPNPGFTGGDSFDFVANDGAFDSAVATITITVEPPLSNLTAGLSLDGDLSDWATLVSFGPDPADVTGPNNLLDWREGWIAHDSDNFYLALRNNTDIVLSWAYNLYLDTDSDSSTGYHGGAAFPIGAEYLVQGGYLFQYAGDGTTWNWSFVTALPQAINGADAEFAFARSAVGNPERMRLFFYGDNIAYPGGTALDVYPDQALEATGGGRFFTYTTAPGGAN